ncbi:hypothetical protein D3C77_237580 [compost metagenome]
MPWGGSPHPEFRRGQRSDKFDQAFLQRGALFNKLDQPRDTFGLIQKIVRLDYLIAERVKNILGVNLS